jgi:ERCC4-related helicase
LTKTQQEIVIQNFKDGEVNIIVATTVAEEGLDISDCNYVIRYGVKGNEISSVQSRGRIRAKGGTYVNLSDAKSKGAEHERRNQYRELLMDFTVAEVQNIATEEFLKSVKNAYKISLNFL